MHSLERSQTYEDICFDRFRGSLARGSSKTLFKGNKGIELAIHQIFYQNYIT